MTFLQAAAVVLKSEGPYDKDPRDPGNWTPGPNSKLIGTAWGISAYEYPGINIANLTQAQALIIFKRDYWDKVRGDELPPSLALHLFDAIVNEGVPTPVRWLQTALNLDPIDGDLGNDTLFAILHTVDLQSLIIEFTAQRIVYLASRPGWAIEGLGWSRRIAALPYQAQRMTAA